MIKLNRLFIENLSRLESILSKRRSVLLDTNVLTGIPDAYNLIGELNKDSLLIDAESLYYYSNYIGGLLNIIGGSQNVLTGQEVSDKEIPKIINILSSIKQSLGICKKNPKIPCKNHQSDPLDDIIPLEERITYYFHRINQAFKDRADFFSNQFEINDYYELREIVNKSYNIFSEDMEDGICADDGLIATSIVLLEKKETPVTIVSNDLGVLNRLRSITRIINDSKNDEIKSKITNLGISFYNCLNYSNLYHFITATRHDSFIKGLDSRCSDADYIKYAISAISNLNFKYAT